MMLSIFSRACLPQSVLFDVFVQIFCSCFKWFVCLFSVLFGVIYILYTSHSVEMWFEHIFSQAIVCSYIFLTMSFAKQKHCHFNEVQFINLFSYIRCVFGVIHVKSLPNPRSQKYYPRLFSKDFYTLCLKFLNLWIWFILS